LSNLEVQLGDPLVELALAAILGAGRQIKVFLGVVESRDQLGLGINRQPGPSSHVWQHQRDWPRSLILNITTLLHGKERRRAFDALRLAQGNLGPLNGNVFSPTFQVWASVVVWCRLAHGRSLT
jgi:hypothetical protein